MRPTSKDRSNRNAATSLDAALAALRGADELFLAGRWREAERELTAISAAHAAARGAVILRLAELRRRQGRLQAAINLYKNLPHHPATQLGMAAVMLDGDNSFGARDWLDRHLEAMKGAPGPERAPGLALDVELRLAHRAWKAAEASARELEGIARAAASPAMQACAAYAWGRIAAARGSAETARRRFEVASREWRRAELPFEEGRALDALSGVLHTLGRAAESRGAARAAAALFEALGAKGELRRAARRTQAAPAKPGAGLESLPLSPRELEVLRMVGKGLPNARIAAKLGLSVYSIDFHLGDILERFDLRDRDAAAAFLEKRNLR